MDQGRYSPEQARSRNARYAKGYTQEGIAQVFPRRTPNLADMVGAIATVIALIAVGWAAFRRIDNE